MNNTNEEIIRDLKARGLVPEDADVIVVDGGSIGDLSSLFEGRGLFESLFGHNHTPPPVGQVILQLQTGYDSLHQQFTGILDSVTSKIVEVGARERMLDIITKHGRALVVSWQKQLGDVTEQSIEAERYRHSLRTRIERLEAAIETATTSEVHAVPLSKLKLAIPAKLVERVRSMLLTIHATSKASLAQYLNPATLETALVKPPETEFTLDSLTVSSKPAIEALVLKQATELGIPTDALEETEPEEAPAPPSLPTGRRNRRTSSKTPGRLEESSRQVHG